jgi:glycerophosphoryl diester phosphodiesterase
MDFDSSDNSSAHYDGKVKTQSFKQLQLERLIKEGKVIPASKLAEAKQQELQRVREFEEAAQEEQRQRRNVSCQPPKDLNVPLTRERFEE